MLGPRDSNYRYRHVKTGGPVRKGSQNSTGGARPNHESFLVPGQEGFYPAVQAVCEAPPGI
jgi:hypothetical protein